LAATVLLDFIPDQAIVRQINYLDVAPNLSFGQYFIWWNLKSDYIGSFTVGDNTAPASSTVGQSMFVSNPQTVITGVEGLTNPITFQIQRQTAGLMVNQTALNGSMNIQIDFLKFKSRR
jgi:hypothetical protein